MTFYLAGADCYEHDRFGKLKLTMAGLRKRDEMVFQLCERHGLPITLTMAGGYARNLQDVVTIHCGTIEMLVEKRAEP